MKNLWDKFTDIFALTLIHPQYFVKKYDSTGIKLALKYAKGTVLDIGCGRMQYKKLLLEKAKRYIGLDNPATVKFYIGDEKPDILADASKKIPLPTKSCDTILLLQVLEHLPNPKETLSEIKRLMRSSGVFILSTVQTYPLHDKPYDFYRFTRYGLKHLLETSGFKIIKQIEEGNLYVLIGQGINIHLFTSLKRIPPAVAVILAPFVLAISTIINIITIPLSKIDRKSDFVIVQTLIAKKRNS